MRVSKRILLAGLLALAGCSSSSPDNTQPPSGNTGYAALVTTADGHYKLYVAAGPSPTTGHAMLAVVDPGAAPGAAALLRYVDLGYQGWSTAVGTSGEDVVVVDRASPTVSFVDAATDTVRGAAALPAGSELILSSANASYSLGAAVDGTHRRVFVSTSTGFAEYDLDTRAQVDTFAAPAVENFALDTSTGRLLAPFTLCSVDPLDPLTCSAYTQPGGPARTDGMTVVDTAAHKAYSFEIPGATNSYAPLGYEPDAVALDLPLQLAVVAVEDPFTLQVLHLDGAAYDAAGLTCTLPRLEVPLPAAIYASVAADVATHLLLAAEEHGRGVAFLDLRKAKQGTIATLEATMPDLPGGVLWETRGDPHGALIGKVDGKTYGFLVHASGAWVARIDMAGVAGVLAGHGALADQVSYLAVAPPP